MLLLFSSACSAEVTVPDTPTPTPQVIITSTLPPTQTPRPSATPVPATPTLAVQPVEGQTTSQLNVRSAPSATSDLLGTVEIFAKVQIVGKDPTSGWWLIVYPDSPNGTGWITAQFVQATDTQDIPVMSGQGQGTQDADITEAVASVEPGSAADPSQAPTPSLASAYADGDSAQSPSASVALSKVGSHAFEFSSDISFPDGDPEDWVRFMLEGQSGQENLVSVVFNCSGSGAFNVELIQNNSVLQGWKDIFCGAPSQLLLTLFVGPSYYLHIFPSQQNNVQNYINYNLIVSLR